MERRRSIRVATVAKRHPTQLDDRCCGRPAVSGATGAGMHHDGFDGLHGGYGVGQRNLEGRMLLEFCLDKELCVSNTWLKREEKRKVTFRKGENEPETDFVLIKKEHR